MPGLHKALQISGPSALAPSLVYVARSLREGNITSTFSEDLPKFRQKIEKQSEQRYYILSSLYCKTF